MNYATFNINYTNSLNSCFCLDVWLNKQFHTWFYFYIYKYIYITSWGHVIDFVIKKVIPITQSFKKGICIQITKKNIDLPILAIIKRRPSPSMSTKQHVWGILHLRLHGIACLPWKSHECCVCRSLCSAWWWSLVMVVDLLPFFNGKEMCTYEHIF